MTKSELQAASTYTAVPCRSALMEKKLPPLSCGLQLLSFSVSGAAEAEGWPSPVQPLDLSGPLIPQYQRSCKCVCVCIPFVVAPVPVQSAETAAAACGAGLSALLFPSLQMTSPEKANKQTKQNLKLKVYSDVGTIKYFDRL